MNRLPKMTPLKNVCFGIYDANYYSNKRDVIRAKLSTLASMMMLVSTEVRFDKQGLPNSDLLEQVIYLIEESAMSIEVACNA